MIIQTKQYCLPSRDIIPQTNQTTRNMPTDPVLTSTSFGDTNIPDPIEL